MCTREEVHQEVQSAERRMEEYTDKSHCALAKTLSDLIGEHKAILNRILEQTTKTNGRVNALETWRQVHTSETGTVTDKLQAIQGTLQKLNWLLIIAAFTALMKTIFIS